MTRRNPSPINRFRHFTWVSALAALIAGASAVDRASSQDQLAAEVVEDAVIRAELQRIIEDDPTQADAARKALEALNQPPGNNAGRQARNRRERGARRIVNGLPARGYPAVGALLRGGHPASARAWCTGTLVGCDKFLTAAHCIAKDPSPTSYTVFFQEFGFFKLKSVHWPKEQYKFPYFDLAMITLERPVEGIAPIQINTTTKPLNKQIATIVGFGRTGGARYDYGIKREGTVSISSCGPDRGSQKLLCWKYDADVKSNSKNSNTCNGDSGGGVLISDTEGSRIVTKIFGVVSGGREENCIKDDLSYNVDVREFSSWISDVGEGRLSSAMCGTPIFANSRAKSQGVVARLSTSRTEASMSLDVPSGLRVLRVALNGEDNEKSDFDLYLYSDKVAQPVCQQDGPGQFAFCEVATPIAGRWTAVVKRKSGEGDVQLTAALVGQ